MNKKWKIALISGALVLTCGLYVWGVPAIVNIESHKSFIEDKIYESSGYRIDIGNPKLSMGLFPSVWIRSNNISILNKDNSKALSIENPKIKIKLFPLLRKKVEIANLSADKEEAHFTYGKDSKFYIGDYLIKLPEKKSGFTLSKMRLNLGQYNISLDDKLNNEQLNLSGEYLKHGKYVQNKHLQFSTKGVFTAKNKSTDILADVDINLPLNSISEDKLKIDMQIKDFDLSSISNYVGTLTNGVITKTSGILNISADTKTDEWKHKKVSININTKDLGIIGKDKASSIIYKDKLNADIDFTTVENGIDFKNITLDSNRIHASAFGKLYNIGKKAPTYDLTAEVKNTRLEDVVAILPGSETLLPDFNLYKLKKYVFFGDGEGKVRFVGQGNRPNVTGEIHLSDAYLIHTMRGASANAKIDMKFIGQRMLLDVFVPASNNQNVTVKGNVLIDGSKYSELDIESTKAVQLAPAQEILNPLHEILKFQLGPVPMMTIDGIGNIKIRSAGKKVDPHIWGAVNFSNATASFNEVHNLVLNNGAGEVVFNDKNVNFKTHHAYINGLPVEIKGNCVMLGDLNVYVTTKGQNVAKLIQTINTSPILVDVQKVVKPFTHPQGIADVFLHIYGSVKKNAEEVVFNEDLFAKGKITLHNSQTMLQDTFIPFTNVNGVVNFDQYNSDYDVNGDIRGSHVRVWGTGTNKSIDLKAHSDNFEINDIFDLLHPDMAMPFKKDIGKIRANFDASYRGVVQNNKLDYNKIKVNGKFLSNINSSDVIRQNGGIFSIDNGVLKTSTLNGLFNGNPFTLSFVAKNLDKEIMNISEAQFNFKDFDISSIDTIKKQVKFPKNMASTIENVSDFKGTVDIAGSVKNNNINSNINLANMSFVYKPFDAVVRIMNGRANLRGNTLYLDKINSRVSSMPVFVDGRLTNIQSSNPGMNILISSKLNQMFFDKVFNEKSVYPIKTKGEISLYSRLSGTLNAIRAKSNLNIGENSSIYYMGATLSGAPTGTLNSEGMTTNPVAVVSDVILYPNKIKINSLNYNQTITSQNKKKSVQNQVVVSGDLSLLKNNVLGFKNVKIKTDNPTNARIFNVLFKKPTIKQGVFTSDITINGTSEAPYILGFLNIKSIDIPLLDSTVRDIDIDFQKDYIYLNSKAVVLTNDIIANAKIVNKPEKPIIVDSINVQMDELNLNTVASSLSDLEADNTRASKLKSGETSQLMVPDMLIIKDANINADKILIKKANATDFKTHMSLGSDNILNVDKYAFNIANGTVDGNIKYNLKDLSGYAEMNIDKTDAQIIAENFFDMPGQVYGTVTGKLNASCTGIESVDCVNTLSGSGKFEVIDGRMPKLGSLEYLLKAGNLITSGVTGVSINGIIDLITPLKTGEFSSIKGDITVKNGVANDINVYSSGQDLNMYMTGSYNLATLVADMEIYGSLSKNFSTLLGKISNASLNTLFNTIPGIKINDINPASTSKIRKIPNFDKDTVLRVFKAEIYGDINGSNYVKSFKWIKD